MKYLDLSRYEKERFKTQKERCLKCDCYINRKYDSIVFTKEKVGLRKIYHFYHRNCYDMKDGVGKYVRG